MLNQGKSIGTPYIPSEGYMGQPRYIRIPSEQARSPRFEDQHFTDHAPLGAGDYRAPRTLPTNDIFRSPSPGYESHEMKSYSHRHYQGGEPAESSYRYFQTPRNEVRQPFKPSNRPSDMRPAHFDKSRTDRGQDRHARPEKKPVSPKPVLVNSGHASSPKSPGTPKKTVHFTDDYPPDSAPRQQAKATKKSRHRQPPLVINDPNSRAASGTQAGQTAHASKTLPNAATSGSHSREGRTRQPSYYLVPPTPRIAREPTPDLDNTKSPYELDPARHQFCPCWPACGADYASGAGAKMHRRLGEARNHIARTSKGTRRITDA